MLLLLFARDGVLPACICDSAKEKIQGKFYQKHKNAAYHYTLPGKMLQKKSLKSLRKGPVMSCCSPEHQNVCEMTA